jgi:hypothetical protein
MKMNRSPFRLCLALIPSLWLVPAGAASDFPAAASMEFSGGVNDVVKLHRAGVHQSVIRAYITGSTAVFSPSADELVRLHELKLPAELVTQMLEKGPADRAKAEAAQTTTVTVPATAASVPSAFITFTTPNAPPQPSAPVVVSGYRYQVENPTGGVYLAPPAGRPYSTYHYAASPYWYAYYPQYSRSYYSPRYRNLCAPAPGVYPYASYGVGWTGYCQ